MTVRVGSPANATRVELQAYVKDVFGEGSWQKLRSTKVLRHRTRTIPVLADSAPSARLRAVVSYRGTSKKAVSRPVVVNYWHWTPLTSFRHYASTGGVYDYGYTSFEMNGSSWTGWETSSSSAESRYTLGRNCTRFKGYVGLTDDSADGSSGKVTLSVVTPQNSLQTVWASPTLRPGAVAPVDLPLASPYRFAIAGQNTSAPVDDRGTLPRAYPAIGDAAFLCHFAS